MSRYSLDQYRALSAYPKVVLAPLPGPKQPEFVFGNWESGLGAWRLNVAAARSQPQRT